MEKNKRYTIVDLKEKIIRNKNIENLKKKGSKK